MAPINMTTDSAETIADRYTLLDKIGEGGMGSVHLARDTQLDRIVAIKILRAQMTDDAAMRFQREAKAIGRLRHGAILTALDFGVSKSGQPYLVLDYLEGETLDQVLETNGGPLEPNVAVDLADRICEGLAYAHSEGIIHRDIKPCNIFLIGGEPHGDAVKILDFGVARFKAEDQHLTTTGSIIGSPPYMSPEQAHGGEADERSDLYSLGCVLFEMLTGSPPLLGATAMETMALKSSEDAPFLSKKAPKIKFSPRLEEIVSKCLRREPSQRYSSIAALEADLKEYLEVALQAMDESATNDSSRALRGATRKNVTVSGVISAARTFTLSNTGKLVAAVALVSLLVTGIITFVAFGNQPNSTELKFYQPFADSAVGELADAVQTYFIDGQTCIFKTMPTLAQVKTAVKDVLTRKECTAMIFDAVIGPMPAEFVREVKPANLKSFHIAHASLNSDCLKAINDLDTVRQLKLTNCRLKGELFPRPEKLTRLETFVISGAKLTKKDLDAILRLPILKFLEVARCEGVTAEFIRSLKNKQTVISISIGASDTTREQLEAVSEIKQLAWFQITKVDDSLVSDSIAALTRLPLLRNVTIEECNSNHEMFKQLASVPALSMLKFDRVKGITRADLLLLKDLKYLDFIEFDVIPPEPRDAILAVLNIKALKKVQVSDLSDYPPDVTSQLKQLVKVVDSY